VRENVKLTIFLFLPSLLCVSPFPPSPTLSTFSSSTLTGGSNAIASTGKKQDADQCAWTCNSDNSKQCGGQSGLDIYKSTNWKAPVVVNPNTVLPKSISNKWAC
jgi:hypothetical protein